MYCYKCGKRLSALLAACSFCGKDPRDLLRVLIQGAEPETDEAAHQAAQDDLPYPGPGDKLFSSPGDNAEQARIGSTTPRDWISYARGYRRAAEILVAFAK